MPQVLSTDEITAVFASLRAGYAQRDPAAIAAHYAETCVVDSPAGAHSGPQAVERTLRAIFTTLPDLSLVPEELLISGNRAVWIGRFEGAVTSGLMEIPQSGKRFSTSAIFLYTFNTDRKIVDERRVYDLRRFLVLLAAQAEPATEAQSLYRELLDQARREHELRLAAEIQHALLPASRYAGTGFEVAATSVPCRAIGGDFFDYYHLPRDGFAFVLGDVAGKGPPAALLASLLQGIFCGERVSRRHTRGFPDAGQRRTRAQGRRGALCHRDLRNAGPARPVDVLQRRTQSTVSREPKRSPAARVGGNGRRGVRACVIRRGHAAALARGRARRLQRRGNGGACSRSPVEIMESLLSTVHQFSAGTAQSDDITMLVLRYTG